MRGCTARGYSGRGLEGPRLPSARESPPKPGFHRAIRVARANLEARGADRRSFNAAAAGAAIRVRFRRAAGRAYLHHLSTHSMSVRCQNSLLRGERTKWASSGKYTSLEGMPRRCRALKAAIDSVSTQR